MTLTDAQRLKFRLLAEGLQIAERAELAIRAATDDEQFSSADYASTTGVILRLDDDVWVNAPTRVFNPNFVGSSPYTLEWDGESFIVEGGGLASAARYWPQPAYHGGTGALGEPLNRFVFTHGDRARLAPVQGCGMTCKFCNIPYEDRYGTKSINAMVDALGRAIGDPVQPAHHVLISGGTPHPRDIEYLQEVYRTMFLEFPTTDIDIMMVPIPGLLDIDALQKLGVHQLSINIEIYSSSIAKDLMRQKYRQGRDEYLRFIEEAATKLGAGLVRSMLMVGLEPIEDTLRGVEAILERGGVPVLSPFRPDPATPLRSLAPPSALQLEEAFLRATELAAERGVSLGPDCIPCTHNTLTLAGVDGAPVVYPYHSPVLI